MNPQPAQTLTATAINAQIQGNNSGQIAIGNYNLQIGSIHGGIVNINMAQPAPLASPRAVPVFIRPRRFDGLLDRVVEVSAAAKDLIEGIPVDFFGGDGAGKSSLLRYFAHHPLTDDFQDGIVYLPARTLPLEDLLQCLYDAFYETITPHKPSLTQIQLALANKKALILLDDLNLSWNDVETLLDAAPQCTFLLASAGRCLWGAGRAYPITGLPDPDAVQLFQRELGRPIGASEQQAALKICEALNGWPLYVLRAAALARERGLPLEKLARFLTSGDPLEQLDRASLAALNPPQKKIVAALAALGGAPMNTRVLARILRIPDLLAEIDTLLRQNVLQPEASGVSLAGRFAETAMQGIPDPAATRVELLSIFKHWLSNQPSGLAAGPGEVVENAGALMNLLMWASRTTRWQDVISLARGMEPALVLNGRWSVWEQVLNTALQAAAALEDLPARAWALHQLGTRAMCLGDSDTARTHLVQALRLRRFLHDRVGAAITRNNLRILFAPPVQPPDHPSDPSGGEPGTSPGDLPTDTNIPVTGGSCGPLLPNSVRRLFLAAAIPTLVATGLLAQRAWAVTAPPPVPGPTATLTAAPVTETQIINTTVPPPPRTATPTSTVTLTMTPTWTATATVTETPVTPTLTPQPLCVVRRDWPVIVIQPGDTLSRLARLTGTTTGELMRANCLTSTFIRAGDRLHVPRLPDPPTITPSVTASITPSLTEAPAADLVISQFSISEQDNTDEGRTRYILVSGNVTNSGNAPADYFNISIHLRMVSMQFDRTFSIDQRFPLAPGEARAFSEAVPLYLGPGVHDLSASIWADACPPEEPPAVCRVAEQSEGNNTAQAEPLQFIVPTLTTEPPVIDVAPTIDHATETYQPLETITPPARID